MCFYFLISLAFSFLSSLFNKMIRTPAGFKPGIPTNGLLQAHVLNGVATGLDTRDLPVCTAVKGKGKDFPLQA